MPPLGGGMEINMVIAHNLQALNAQRQLGITTNKLAKSTEKMSSGYRINRAADDAAGLAISEKMRKQIRGLDQVSENLEDGISYAQVADGALHEVQDMLQRINELAVKAANGTNSASDREDIDKEVQQLKTELERVFVTTKFNERQIWPDENVVQTPTVIGTTKVQAVQVTTPYRQPINITNNNYNLISYGPYKINADDTGVKVSWTDYDGNPHTTNYVDWGTLKANNYSFRIGDYFDKTNDPDLFDTADKPVFDFGISFSVSPSAGTDDIIASINDTYMSASLYTDMSGIFEDPQASSQSDVSVYSSSLNYGAAYASRAAATAGQTGFDFDAANDNFIDAANNAGTRNTANLISIPANSTDLNAAKSSTDTWSFNFQMDGIGKVTATSDSVSYYGTDSQDEDFKFWWDWSSYYTNGGHSNSISWLTKYSSAHGAGTLGSVMDALTGDKSASTPGILNKNLGGCSDNGGHILLGFDLTSENAFNVGTSTSSSVGRFTLIINVTNQDTEQTVLNKINKALYAGTIFDLYVSSFDSNSTSQTVRQSSKNTVLVDQNTYEIRTVYQDTQLAIHAGAETRDKIYFKYKTLRLGSIGLQDTNVLTEDSATNAINEVSDALSIVNAQRSLFGAYQNRMEHAYNMNQNTAENTTAAESQIRDTDMAKEMVSYSMSNILSQVG